MTPFVIGIDSGGTNYRVLAADLSGHILGSYTGQPASHLYLPREEMLRRVNDNIDACLAQFGGSRADIRALVCGTTGDDSEQDELYLIDFYSHLDGISCPVKVMNDAELAHYTVLGGKQGILIISGTGSIAFGIGADGRRARSGGWSYTIMGDEGSGAWVTRMALHEVGRFMDGLPVGGEMVRRICDTLSLHTREDLIALSGGPCQSPSDMPGLGIIVNEAAAAGDAAAIRILEQAADELTNIILDTAQLLEEKGPALTVGLWGSNVVHSPLIQSRLLANLQKTYPEVITCLADRTAVEAAAQLAAQMVQ